MLVVAKALTVLWSSKAGPLPADLGLRGVADATGLALAQGFRGPRLVRHISMHIHVSVYISVYLYLPKRCFA